MSAENCNHFRLDFHQFICRIGDKITAFAGLMAIYADDIWTILKNEYRNVGWEYALLPNRPHAWIGYHALGQMLI